MKPAPDPLRWFSVFAFMVWAAMASAAGFNVSFASMDEGRRQLTMADEFVGHLSPFDRAARLKTERDVAGKEYLEYVSAAVREWTPAETNRLGALFATLKPKLQAFRVSVPATVWLVKTTGREEGAAAYTRGGAIVVPESELKSGDSELQGLLAHECFHVLSRNNPRLKDALYAVIGFQPCAEIRLTPDLARRQITNPDAPFNDHSVELSVKGVHGWWVPVLVASSDHYDSAKGGEFFDYLQVMLAPAGLVDPVPADRLVPMDQAKGLLDQVGHNTTYLIHPEEILADNFKLLVTGGTVKSPEVIARLKAVLMRGEDAPK